mmetsp:Transcript_127330/g.189839  ORF Transcript_127330/g.189839 Transcript_127330/m.189839 type:complete len:212 (-) Transcript_127330:71-706(-)|eukprot:CAMPEP_0117045016 /NCGR_PEP_ID=MMETSP0472-20121206/31167_1 /TAXON_ID=693140 ORGANISM="Tiarina fusus, Strain LIS" /NCGR_SAMPLE_ID=MMETSP0472 /ASSEMBLY_ACC=CAM_ASM_000603 /LENGTH=211 /DNA_ID=CAMNT_0004756905 /DNA_START=80 /DNA_END=715 /DNA_ORIENTATION=-
MKACALSLLLLSTATAFTVLPPQATKTTTKLSVGSTWHEPHNENPIQQFVSDMFRVFDIHEDDRSTKKHFAVGYSGDIGSGPTTAYKALPPKPWKAPVVEEVEKKVEPNKFVKDAARVFDIHREEKKVHVNPVGFAGDVGYGPTTAYKALAPKPWKAPAPEEKKIETNQLVKDASRVFVHEKKMHPTGYSGYVGGGPTTAYDALPPKPWKP